MVKFHIFYFYIRFFSAMLPANTPSNIDRPAKIYNIKLFQTVNPNNTIAPPTAAPTSIPISV